LNAALHDDILLQKARTGDEQAFGRLVGRYEATVRGIVRGVLGTDDGADDVAQEVFVKFYRSLDNFKGDAKLSTYLGRIAINTALTAVAKRKRRRWLAGGDADTEVNRTQADHSQAPERADLRDALQKALSRLSEDYRTVVVLRLVEGYSVAETASILDLPLGTVASRLSRAQQELKNYLQPILNL
jgi:RNA polymerase sigma-70 factor, ECF subfamily